MAESSVHAHKVPLRWSDFDRYGHVMNANYVEIAQEARLAFAEDAFTSKGIDFAAFVRHLELDFRLPIKAQGNTELLVESVVSEIGTTSFVTRQEIKDYQGNTACVVETTQVTVDLLMGRPRPLTDQEKAILSDIGAADNSAQAEQ